MCFRRKSIKEKQSYSLVRLMTAMIVLVLLMIVSTIWNAWVNREYKNEFNKQVCEIISNAKRHYNTHQETLPATTDTAKQFKPYTEEQSLAQASKDEEYALIRTEDLEYILQQHITDHSSIMDANNYLAIILTLITLCVTLAAVIPYIMGKSILEKDIKDTLEKMEHKESVKYRNLVDQLERAEAHLSRMTAYTLLVEYKLNKCNSSKVPNLNIHPYWVIGWASKAIIRYQKCTSKGFATNQFMDNCAEYIKEAAKVILKSNISKDKDGVILRAFVDLYDVLQLNNIYKPREFQKNVSDLEDLLGKLWEKLKECYKEEDTNVEDTLFDLIKQKTKRTEYLDSDADEDVRKRFNEWKSSRK